MSSRVAGKECIVSPQQSCTERARSGRCRLVQGLIEIRKGRCDRIFGKCRDFANLRRGSTFAFTFSFSPPFTHYRPSTATAYTVPKRPRLPSPPRHRRLALASRTTARPCLPLYQVASLPPLTCSNDPSYHSPLEGDPLSFKYRARQVAPRLPLRGVRLLRKQTRSSLPSSTRTSPLSARDLLLLPSPLPRAGCARHNSPEGAVS